MIGGAKIIQEFGFLSYEVAVTVTSLVILSYILLAGFRAILITDVIQSIIILVLLFLVTFNIIGGVSLSNLFSAEVQPINFFVVFGFFVFGILNVFSQANMYQLIYSAKTKNKARNGFSLVVVPIIIAGFLLMLIGLFMAINIPGLDSGLIFAEALRSFLPVSLIPLAIVLFFAGVMSSEDTDIYTIVLHFSKQRKGDFVKNIRFSSIVLVVLSLAVSLIFRDVVDVSIVAGGLSVVLSFPMIYLISGGQSSKKFLVSFFLGLLALIVSFIFLGPEPKTALPVIICSVLGLLWKK